MSTSTNSQDCYKKQQQITDGLMMLSKHLKQVVSPEQQSPLDSIADGVTFENDVFSMDQFCECQAGSCPVCSGDRPNFVHKASGFSVAWYRRIDQRVHTEGIHPDYRQMFDECLLSIL